MSMRSKRPLASPRSGNRLRLLTLAAALAWAGLGPTWVLAQTQVKPGERLSDWILRQPEADGFLPALQWQVPAERAAQEQLRRAVLSGLRLARPVGANREAIELLSERLSSLPLTGRATLAVPDARWLQAAPEQDPVLQDGHQVVLPARPSTVTVLTDSGIPCAVLHAPGALIQHYLRACLGAASAEVDDAWLVQPDGRTARYGVADWNTTEQLEVGLGAWIWAPRRQAGLPQALSDNLARFLATQLPGELVWPRWHGPDQRLAVSWGPDQPGRPRRPRDPVLTASDWGEIGLLQTPTARMAEAGTLRLHLSRVAPYTRGTTMFQPLDWLEAGFRYTDIGNRLYSEFPGFSGSQTYKDKSIDFKLRLREETDFWPQVSLGVRDVGGTGLFSGEYLVASKRWGDFDLNLGLGWGYLGARGNIKNPFSSLGKQFETRPAANVGQGGTVGLSTWFRGPTALFGGVQWHVPESPWIFKLELDGNNYQNEPQSNNQPTKSPINFGAVYRYSPNVDFSFGLERGNRLMVGLTLHSALNKISIPKLLDPPLPKVLASAPQAPPAEGWAATAADIERFTGWKVRALDHQPGTTSVYAETDGALYLQVRVERAIIMLHRDAPASTRRFVLHLQERGLPMTRLEVDRAEWLSQHLVAQSPSLLLPTLQHSAGQTDATRQVQGPAEPYSLWTGKPPGLSMELGPTFNPIIGGPTSFMLYRLGLAGRAEYRFSDNTWVTGIVGARLLDNYDQFNYTGPSNLPRVRTLVREYETSSRITLPLAQLTHVRDLGGGHYLSAYAGMLEPMFGGAGAEWLYRPWKGELSFGVDVNHVRQRDFRQNLSFRDYGVTTGHASVYWDTGWNNVQVKLSAGRYLAGDMGATLDVKRSFDNGITLGAFATKTNVSAAQFGEGSFDKGVYLTLPFDAILPLSNSGSGTLFWSPLTRDGGARLNRAFPLFELTKQRDRRALQWGTTARAGYNTGENNTYVLTEPRPDAIQTMGSTTGNLARQLLDVPGSTWLWAGGALLASSLLDKPVDKWAQRQGAGTSSAMGTASTAIPWALAIGSGLAFTGIAGEGAQSTGETSLKAAALTLVGNLGLRYLVGRARPYENLGPTEFNGLRRDALKSSFASNHTAVAFALATPFAQQHNMPWLYGVAAATALGRVQKREHWVSDTVAGALLGYAIGSLLVDQQRGRDGVRLSLTPQSVVAHWSF